MNRWLMKSIVDLAAYLSLDAPIPDDMASQYLDIIEPTLQHLTSEERAEFAGYIAELAAVARQTEADNASYIWFLDHLPENLGFVAPIPQLYFVRHLHETDPEIAQGQEFEVQVLDAQGRARVFGLVGQRDIETVIEGHLVPEAVVAAAKRLSKGSGDYVNESGESINPLASVSSILKEKAT